MTDMESKLLVSFVGWLPLIIIMAIWLVVLRSAGRRHREMIELGRENNEVVRTNTEAVKALTEELIRRGSK